MTTLGITGASGQLGASVLRHLLARLQASEIVAVTRTPDKVTNAPGAGVRVRSGDFDDEGSLVSAFAGIDRLLLIPATDLVPGVRPRQHLSLIHISEPTRLLSISYAVFC